MLSETQIREIIQSHLEQTVETGAIQGGNREVAIYKIDPLRAIRWKGNDALEVNFTFSSNITVTDGMTSSSREYIYRKTLVVTVEGKTLHATKAKLERDIKGLDFDLDL